MFFKGQEHLVDVGLGGVYKLGISTKILSGTVSNPIEPASKSSLMRSQELSEIMRQFSINLFLSGLNNKNRFLL